MIVYLYLLKDSSFALLAAESMVTKDESDSMQEIFALFQDNLSPE